MEVPLDSVDERALPPCPHFGVCGGCQLQHLTYAAQLARKAEKLRTLLVAASLNLPQLQIHASPPLGYRNRIRLTLGEVDGQLRAGYLTAHREEDGGNPSFLPITECPIAAPLLWRTAEAIVDRIRKAPPVLRTPRFKLDQLELFTTADESAVQITLFVRSAARNLPAQFAAEFNVLCESVRAVIPQLTGGSMAILPVATTARSRRNENARAGASWGAPGLLYRVTAMPESQGESSTNWVPRGTFFQVNRFLIPKLLSLVTANRSGVLAFDLYAGVGLFSRALAQTFARVVAVEVAEPAASALAATKLANLRAVEATTHEFLRAAVVDRDRPELIVLDPPRTGAGIEVCGLLARLAAPTLVYVSCSPETLPADLSILTSAGYTISELHMLDLFPQTTHIETVVVLTHATNAVFNYARV
jgi:23S rRNA (uracil1939-C5)-methyltransferase